MPSAPPNHTPLHRYTARSASRSDAVRELCGFSLVTSDDPAAEYVRDALGQERIDATIKDLRLSSTAFPAGFSERELGPLGRANTTTATDTLRLIEHIERTRHRRRVPAHHRPRDQADPPGPGRDDGSHGRRGSGHRFEVYSMCRRPGVPFAVRYGSVLSCRRVTQ
ncbi:serine hydrolase [Kitasatospora sp. NPDC059327]|uniref:serine hydrolase n=1 Tax=Kitasatospora sp. NPDC059327 TaxID=3346803 RepID=UPI0036D15558